MMSSATLRRARAALLLAALAVAPGCVAGLAGGLAGHGRFGGVEEKREMLV